MSIDSAIMEAELQYIATFDLCGNALEGDKNYKSNLPPDDMMNWIQIIHGKRWYMILPLYGPVESWCNKTWKPGEMEEVK
jgi:hypothetical protein